SSGAGTHKPKFRVVVEGDPRPLHPLLRDEVYRIGREAILNAFRHSQASHIEAELRYLPRQLQLLVRDDGTGIDKHILQFGREKHWGLTGMRERAERIGAKLHVTSRDSAGTEIQLDVPAHLAFLDERPKRKWFRDRRRRR
ncbi:MAG TPA: ATP-binding protein, partial [Bryobacteraceae bacterium]|nr:ATP-binding protein [Bryobacteraceae bacterium]